MRHVAPILDLDPKMKVIYYSRDPHGIMSSLKKLREIKAHTVQGMCAIMEDDFLNYLRLKKDYPNRVTWLRYEDLALRPEKTAARIYKFSTGRKHPPESVSRWIDDNTHADRSEYNGITGTRRNSTANVREWHHIISKGTSNLIDQHCHNVLKLLHYDEGY